MAAADAKSKKRKRVVAAPPEEEAEVVNPDPPKKKKAQKPKTSKKEKVTEKQDAVAIIATEVEDQGEEDDQTAALLAGFESESDAEDPEEDIKWDESDVTVPNLSKTQRKALEKAEQASKSNGPGVVYVGRVPRGFFEPQMKKYFTQFGSVKRLRLSRNKKTGASKHYAFVEFASVEVADIVARTMDNYLMFGHILKCKLIPAEQVHENLFKGANARFKVDPRNKKAGNAMERGASREKWESRVERENEKRRKREEELREVFGYEYKALEVRSVGDVPRRMAVEEKADQEAARQLLLEAGQAVAEEVEEVEEKEAKGSKKQKASKKGKATKEIEEKPQEVEAPKSVPEKKSKKTKAAKEAEAVPQEIETAEPVPQKKTKKAKAVKQAEEKPQEVEAAEPVPVPEKKTKKITRKIVVEMEVAVEPAAEKSVTPQEPEKKRKAKAEPKPAAKAKKAKKVQT